MRAPIQIGTRCAKPISQVHQVVLDFVFLDTAYYIIEHLRAICETGSTQTSDEQLISQVGGVPLQNPKVQDPTLIIPYEKTSWTCVYAIASRG